MLSRSSLRPPWAALDRLADAESYIRKRGEHLSSGEDAFRQGLGEEPLSRGYIQLAANISSIESRNATVNRNGVWKLHRVRGVTISRCDASWRLAVYS
jgi:hypothetical protein